MAARLALTAPSFEGRPALVCPHTGSWNHSTTSFAPASATAWVCVVDSWFLAMAVSVSEMATKPRPSRESPTMTMRLTRSAEPRSLRRSRFLRWIRFMMQLLIARGRVAGRAALAHQVAVLRDARFTGDGIVETDLAQLLPRECIVGFLELPPDGDG